MQTLQAHGQTVFSDAHGFGDSAMLTRGFVLDQLRRFGPFDTFINVLAPPDDKIVCAADALPELVEQPLRVLAAATDLWGKAERRLIMVNGLQVPVAWGQAERLMLERLITQTPQLIHDTVPFLTVSVLNAEEAIKSPSFF